MLCAWALRPARWVERELPGWAAFAGTVGMVDRVARASQAGMLAVEMEAAVNIPGMMAIATGSVVAPGTLVASVERCP